MKRVAGNLPSSYLEHSTWFSKFDHKMIRHTTEWQKCNTGVTKKLFLFTDVDQANSINRQAN